MTISVHLDETDQRVLRYLERKCIEGGGGDWVTITPDDIMRDNGLGVDQTKRLIARFKEFGFVATDSADGTLVIKEIVCHRVTELDRRPPPNHWEIAKRWALSKPWLVYPGIVLVLVLPWCVGLVKAFRFLLEWFGVN